MTQIDTETRNGKVLIHVREERLDAHNSGDLRDQIIKIIEGDTVDIIVDLSMVRFIDSSGLGALLSGYKNAILRSGTFVLAGLQPRVQSMFELTRLHRVFDIFPSAEDAFNKA